MYPNIGWFAHFKITNEFFIPETNDFENNEILLESDASELLYGIMEI